MTKILVAGDWHGTTRWALAIIEIAKRENCGAIVQCGDFGIWTHEFNGHEYLDRLNSALTEANMHLIFVRGNHENKDHLDILAKINPRSKNGHVYLRSNILYSEDGTVWTWDHKKFMSVGGAVSIDKEWRLARERQAGVTRSLWWPGEQLTDADVFVIEAEIAQRRRAGKQEVDYLFTHDCSNMTPWKTRMKPDFESQMHRQRIDRVLSIVRPKTHFHGHMHEVYDWEHQVTDEHVVQTYGLACDGMVGNYGVLNTETDEFVFDFAL